MGLGLLRSAMAVSDVFLVKSIATGIAKLGVEAAVDASVNEAIEGTTTVYRNFGWNEYNALRANGNNFEIGSNFGSKQFWLDSDGINWWNSTGFSKNFTAEITINKAALQYGTEFMDAGAYRAISFDSPGALNIFNQNMTINWIMYK